MSAVIDFGTLAVGDPACDLLAAWTFLPAQAREVYRDLLGVDDATWARGRGWGLAAMLPPATDPSDDRALFARAVIDELIADHRRGTARSPGRGVGPDAVSGWRA